MSTEIRVSTPSRLCLFGEHLDYLGLEVIAVAINLRFSAKITKREDGLIRIRIRDALIDTLNAENTEGLYSTYEFDLEKPIPYENNRDYLRSTVNVLLRAGYKLCGFDMQMDSEIPIGKGMCSSSTMIVALTKAMLEAIGHEDANNPEKIAHLAFDAEVTEFGEPGGMMDHYTSALGGLVNLSFPNGETEVYRLSGKLGGKINGSGGGGCGYVYARKEDCEKIMKAIEALGYPMKKLMQDTGVRKEN